MTLETDIDDSIIELIYEDSANLLKSVQENINSINTRLGVVIGFNVTSILLSSKLPGRFPDIALIPLEDFLPCNSCLLFKVLTYIFLISSLFFSLWGFSPQSKDTFIFPKRQLEKSSSYSGRDFRIAIIEARDEMIIDLMKLVHEKADRLRYALIALGVAASSAALDVIITSIFYQ